MKEPYVESNIYDLTGNLAAAPSDDGYPIVGAVFSPTGPIEKRKVLSQKDFIDNYLLSSTVLPTDHDSIKFLFKVLEVNPVYVVRACPVTVLEGISSKGRSLLFDKAYNLLSKYYQFKIEAIKDSKDYYYMIIGDTMYITGNLASIPVEEIGDYDTKVLSNSKSLDLLLDLFIREYNKEDSAVDFIDCKPGYLQSRVPVTKWSSNVGLHKEIKEEGKYSTISTLNNDSILVNELRYINISGTSYYFSGRNYLSPTAIPLPVRITSPDNQSSILSKYFMLKVIGTSNCKMSGSLEFAIKDVSNVTNYDVKFLDTNINSLSITSEGARLLLLDNSMINVDDGFKYISFENDTKTESQEKITYTFTLGTDTERATPTNVRISLGTKSCTTYEFISRLLDYVISNNSTIYDSAKSTSIVFTEGRDVTIYEKAENTLSSDIYAVMEDEGKLTYQYYTSVDDNNEDYITFDSLGIVVGDYYYYTGIPESSFINAVSNRVPMSDDPVTYKEFISLLQYNLFITQNIGMFNDAFICTEVTVDEEGHDKSVELDYDSNKLTVTDKFVHQSAVEQFAIVQRFPSKSSIMRFSYKKNAEDGQILDLTLNFKNGISTEDWTMSFVPGVTDGYGIDQWYERVQNPYMKVVSLTEEGKTGELADEVEAGEIYESPYFGGKVGVPEFNIQYMKDAIQEIPEYDDDQYYYMITDSGVINASYASIIQTLCSTLKAWYPVSLPSSTKNPNDLISFVGGANLNSYFVRMLAAGDREEVAGFSAVMPGSLKLIRGILDLYRNQSQEFAPHYDLNNGTVGVSNLVQSFTKTQRELLLDHKIESLKGGVGSPYYINDNVTAQKKTSYLSENQNVLMTIAAVHECEGVARYFKAELNTKATRKRFQDALNSALEDRLFKGKAYAPYSYYAICDETNNPLNVINDNKLVATLYAQYTPSAKKIILDHFIIPLQQA
jgi:hypothetical protein